MNHENELREAIGRWFFSNLDAHRGNEEEDTRHDQEGSRLQAAVNHTLMEIVGRYLRAKLLKLLEESTKEEREEVSGALMAELQGNIELCSKSLASSAQMRVVEVTEELAETGPENIDEFLKGKIAAIVEEIISDIEILVSELVEGIRLRSRPDEQQSSQE